MRNALCAIAALCAAILLLADAAPAASGSNGPLAGLASGWPAFVLSGNFLAGLIGGVAVTHLAHLLWRAGQRVVARTFMFGGKTLRYSAAVVVLAGIILMI